MALGVGVQGLVTSSKGKQNMHKHAPAPIISTSTKSSTSRTYFFVIYKTFSILREFE